MKTSKIIIISFFIFIIGAMLILFIEAKKHKKEMFKNLNNKEIALPPFSVIVADEGTNFHIVQSNSNKFTFELKKNENMSHLKFVIKNDTLFLTGKAVKTTVNCKNIKSIITNKRSWVVIEKISSDSLQINARGGELFIELPEENLSKMAKLRITSSNHASVRITNLLINNLSINSDNSEVKVYCAINSLQCRLSNNSKLFSQHNPNVLNMERDSSSGITMYP